MNIPPLPNPPDALLDRLQRLPERRWKQRIETIRALVGTPMLWEQAERVAQVFRTILAEAEVEGGDVHLYGVSLFNKKALKRHLGRFVNGLRRTLIWGAPLTLLIAFGLANHWAEQEKLPISPGMMMSGYLVGYIILALFWVPFSFLHDIACNNRVRAAAAEALGYMVFPANADVLVSACHDNTAEKADEVRQASRHALRVVLPTVTAAHVESFSPEFIPNLCRLLNYWGSLGDKEPPVFLIQALGRFGDGRALKVLAEWWKRNWHGLGGEAERALAAIQQRLEPQIQRATLLRASALPNATPEELLRPAAGGETDTAAEQLLRASDEQDINPQP